MKPLAYTAAILFGIGAIGVALFVWWLSFMVRMG